MRAAGGYREDLGSAAHQKHRLAIAMTDKLSAIGEIGVRNAEGEVGSARVRMVTGHLLLRRRAAAGVAHCDAGLPYPTGNSSGIVRHSGSQASEFDLQLRTIFAICPIGATRAPALCQLRFSEPFSTSSRRSWPRSQLNDVACLAQLGTISEASRAVSELPDDFDAALCSHYRRDLQLERARGSLA
ncbi:hypothetical protein D9M70_535970 [compost metagenome]